MMGERERCELTDGEFEAVSTSRGIERGTLFESR